MRTGLYPMDGFLGVSHGQTAWNGGPLGIPLGSDPPLSLCSGQKYLTAVVKLFGPLTRNYYIRAVLHAA